MDFALPHKLRSSLDENGTIYLTTYNNQGSEVYRDHIADINKILENNFSELSDVVNVIVCLEDDRITAWPQHKVEEFIQMDAPGIAHFKPQYISAISSNGNALKVDGISRMFELGDEKIHALKDVSFDVHAGKLALIRGRSGSGKTTLLNLITALAQPTNGENCVGNLSVTDMTGSEIIQYRGKQISFIFQTFGLLPYLTVEENVEVPLRLVNTPCKERQE